MNTTTRRHFLGKTLLGTSAACTIPAFLQNTSAQLTKPLSLGLSPETGKDSTILVVLQLAGGNDGLNTLVPFQDDTYHRLRTRIAKKKKDLLTINDQLALNSSLPSLRKLYDQGELAIVQGVGYPNPNRSHFISTSVWETADTKARASTGWLGRYFDNECSGAEPGAGISLIGHQPESFQAQKHNKGISISTPDLYQWLHETNTQKETFIDLNKPQKTNKKQTDSNLAFLQRVALDAQMSSQDIHQLIKRTHIHTTFPASPLGRQLELVARMIAGNMPTRVYYLSQGGYDTHDNQAGRHEQLLSQLDSSINAFTKELRRQKNHQRVLLMTFSEFGRRVAENASGGTDHGKASCLFVLGAQCKGGLYGSPPSLTKLDAGDLAYKTDFRRVYSTVLEQWLHAKSQPILKSSHTPLAFL